MISIRTSGVNPWNWEVYALYIYIESEKSPKWPQKKAWGLKKAWDFRLETKMPWHQTPSREKKAVVFTNVN